jgi:hypothetical protein
MRMDLYAEAGCQCGSLDHCLKATAGVITIGIIGMKKLLAA